MTPVKPQYQNLRSRSLAKWALMCYGRSTHERLLTLLSESSRSYMLEYHLSAFVLLATVLSTFRQISHALNTVQIGLEQVRPTRYYIQTKC